MKLKWRNVGLIFHREVRDQLRDRRTLFMILILPMLLYPALGIGMVQLTLVFTEQSRTVVILGEKSLPPPPLMEGNRFISSWFRDPASADKLEVISDREEAEDQVTPSKTPEAGRKRMLLAEARRVRDKLREHDQLRSELKQAELAKQTSVVDSLKTRLQQQHRELAELFSAGHMQVLILIPDQFNAQVARVNQAFARKQFISEGEAFTHPVIVHNDADEKSLLAFNRVLEAVHRWEQAILKQRLEDARLPASFPKPVDPVLENLALKDQLASNMWSKLVPMLVVLMSITGAFYPAIDLGAGEKERGTMETLLICPASRVEIVLGKFLTVFCFSICTAVLNLLSLGMTSSHIMNVTGKLGEGGQVAPPGMETIAITAVLLIPLAAMFSALCLAFATFARSTKEGQYYLTPLLMVTLGLTVFCLSPGVELTPFYSVIPVMGVSLLLKGLLMHSAAAGHLYVFALPVLVTTLGYGSLALWWAIDQFRREDVLFREAERFEIRLWLKHLLRDKEPLPSSAEAIVCFLLIILLQFGISPGNVTETSQLLYFVLTQQITMIACPALFMALLLTTDFRRTLKLRLPAISQLVLAAGLACFLHPITIELNDSLKWFFPKLPDSVVKFLESLNDPSQSIWVPLAVMALAPAICEELAFRGFILSGFSRSGRTALGILLSSVAFGAMHMIPQQVFNATLLGLVLGLIAARTRSLLPGILFHFVYNSLAILHGKYGVAVAKLEIESRFFDVSNSGMMHYTPLTLSISAIAGGVILRHFWLMGKDSSGTTNVAPPPLPIAASLEK